MGNNLSLGNEIHFTIKLQQDNVDIQSEPLQQQCAEHNSNGQALQLNQNQSLISNIKQLTDQLILYSDEKEALNIIKEVQQQLEQLINVAVGKLTAYQNKTKQLRTCNETEENKTQEGRKTATQLLQPYQQQAEKIITQAHQPSQNNAAKRRLPILKSPPIDLQTVKIADQLDKNNSQNSNLVARQAQRQVTASQTDSNTSSKADSQTSTTQHQLSKQTTTITPNESTLQFDRFLTLYANSAQQQCQKPNVSFEKSQFTSFYASKLKRINDVLLIVDYPRMIYETINTNQKKVLIQILSEVSSQTKKITFKQQINIEEYKQLLTYFRMEFPEIYFFNLSTYYFVEGNVVSADVENTCNVTEQEKVIAVAKSIVDNAKKNNIPLYIQYQKYIDDNVTYDGSDIKTCHNVVGCLLRHKAVCAGIARSWQLVAEIGGIKSVRINGDAIGTHGRGRHSWNSIEINGSYYNCDFTFNLGEQAMKYICCDDEYIRASHFKDNLSYKVTCNKTDLFYYNDIMVDGKSDNFVQDVVRVINQQFEREKIQLYVDNCSYDEFIDTKKNPIVIELQKQHNQLLQWEGFVLQGKIFSFKLTKNLDYQFSHIYSESIYKCRDLIYQQIMDSQMAGSIKVFLYCDGFKAIDYYHEQLDKDLTEIFNLKGVKYQNRGCTYTDTQITIRIEKQESA